jgi:hypothetical protein
MRESRRNTAEFRDLLVEGREILAALHLKKTRNLTRTIEEGNAKRGVVVLGMQRWVVVMVQVVKGRRKVRVAW